jgi:hypothetical protein
MIWLQTGISRTGNFVGQTDLALTPVGDVEVMFVAVFSPVLPKVHPQSRQQLNLAEREQTGV